MTSSTPEAAGDDASPVYEASPECTVDDLEVGARYLATVDGVVDYGIFVQLAPTLSGLVHESLLDTTHAVGDEIIVELREIRENGDLSFQPASGDPSNTVRLEADYDITPVEDLSEVVGDLVHVHGEIAQIKQTGGPTLFHVRDETGVVPCAAFEKAGVRAYPDLEVHDLVHVVGWVDRREKSIQVEVDRLEPLADAHAPEAHERIRVRLSAHADPPEIDPLVEWDALEAHWDDLRSVATLLRQAAIEHRPVYLRYHADADGMCAALPLAKALER
ncbi:MAG: OB-fold nucleic acid binding domain-containing protein, partial [Halobacteriales archaeon]|nr:OB-fold nucleic acid binding domain-containing protein [Halobacteriales archaeon]